MERTSNFVRKLNKIEECSIRIIIKIRNSKKYKKIGLILRILRNYRKLISDTILRKFQLESITRDN